MFYSIDYDAWDHEGGSCQVYYIKNHKKSIFKEFYLKKTANESYSIHKELAGYDLAPKILSNICRLQFSQLNNNKTKKNSNWGYIIEKAFPVEHNFFNMKAIQNLVDEIYNKTGLEFWDCHWYNVGIVRRKNQTKIVCIDTGKESFNSNNNAWGLGNPGPKCNYCNFYTCECAD
jgi:hypothetical protein